MINCLHIWRERKQYKFGKLCRPCSLRVIDEILIRLVTRNSL